MTAPSEAAGGVELDLVPLTVDEREGVDGRHSCIVLTV
jgi:hypothetical protein